MEELEKELRQWLNQQFISSANIGNIRRRLFVPWSSQWNAIVRDATAERENIYPEGLGTVISVISDPFVLLTASDTSLKSDIRFRETL